GLRGLPPGALRQNRGGVGGVPPPPDRRACEGTGADRLGLGPARPAGDAGACRLERAHAAGAGPARAASGPVVARVLAVAARPAMTSAFSGCSTPSAGWSPALLTRRSMPLVSPSNAGSFRKPTTNV